jgi:NAD(P)-dependent dehydrogenase (short-subunit alcohol dehydrogenase family)
MGELQGRVALVTGASRGIGKGIAQVLGAAGATVYITGRTEGAATATVPLPGSIHETAAIVNDAGGTCIALRCDHGDDGQVRSVFDQIISKHQRLDILVNNAWSGYQAKQRSGKSGFKTAFWRMPPDFWDSMHTVGVRSMVEQGSGLIVHLSVDARAPSDNVAYGTAKASVNRMAAEMAPGLAQHGVTILSLCPFIVATEMIMANKKSQDLAQWMESPQFVGRAVVALATDPAVARLTGATLSTRQLALDYGLTDIDGHVPTLPPGARSKA